MKKTFRTILAGVFAFLAVSCYDDSALKKQNDLLKEELENLKESLVDASEFGIDREDLFLMYSAEKSLTLTAEGVAEYCVMNEPAGWQASIEGTTLNIKAPAKEAYEHGAAALKGEIVIYATSNTGAGKIAKLAVESGAGLRLSVDGEGNVTIKNAYATSVNDVTVFQDFEFGIARANDFYGLIEHAEMFGTSDVYEIFEKAYEMMSGCPAGVSGLYSRLSETQNEYIEGTYETDIISTTLSMLSNALSYPVTNGAYVIWGVPRNESGDAVGDFVFADYANVNVDIELVESTHNDLKVKVSTAGADGYFIGFVSESQTKMGGGIMPMSTDVVDFTDFDAYMCGQTGPWTILSKHGAPYQLSSLTGGSPFDDDMIAEVFSETGLSLAEFMLEPLKFNERYYFWVMPVFRHLVKYDPIMDIEDYSAYEYETHFKPYVKVFETNDIQAGGMCVPTIEFTGYSYTTLDAAVTVSNSDNVSSVYYALFQDARCPNSDAAICNAVLEACQYPEEGGFERSFDRDCEYTELAQGALYTLAVVAIDKNGKYTVKTESCPTKGFPTTINNDYSVTFGSVMAEYESVSVHLTPSTEGVTYYKFYQKTEYELAENIMEDVLVNGSICSAQGNVTRNYASPETSYVLAVLVLGTDGEDYKVLTHECSTKKYPYDEENIKLSLVSLERNVSNDNEYTAVFSVTGASDVVYKLSYSGDEFSMPLAVVKNAPSKNTNYGDLNYAEVSNGQVQITFTSTTSFFNYNSDIYVVAYNIEDNAVSSMSKILSFSVNEKYQELQNSAN